MKIFSLGAALLAGLFCLSSAPTHSPDANREANDSASAKTELLSVHQAARRAHFNRDVDFIVAGMGPEFTTVHEGNIRVMSREDVRKHSEKFRGAEFSAWDTRSPGYSNIARRKNGLGDRSSQDRLPENRRRGATSKEDTVMAWMSAYEKHDGKWLLVAKATTSKP